MANFFFKNSFSVFSYNYKGTYDSQGDSIVGLSESLVDLDHTLQFLKSDRRFNSLPLFLVEHSWGGFATGSVLNYSPLIEQLHSDKLPKDFIEDYQKKLFPLYYMYTASEGISKSNIPVLVAHGNQDKIIDYNLQSIISQARNIHNPLVEYYTGTGLKSGHNEIWHSDRSIEYSRQVDARIKQLLKDFPHDLDKTRVFVNSVDHSLYSEINQDLFQKILKMFNSTL